MKKPSHLFTKDELQKLIYNADDFKGMHSILVVRPDGYLDIVNDIADDQHYPVQHTAFDAGAGYVGKEAGSDETYIESLYHETLVGWLHYFERYFARKKEGTVYLDGSLDSDLDDSELVSRIKQAYAKLR